MLVYPGRFRTSNRLFSLKTNGRRSAVDPTRRLQAIKAALEQELAAVHVEVVDHSARHAGHAGPEAGAGHFKVLVVSGRFEGLNRVAAQRLVYSALGNLMHADIHAVSMKTLTPGQWSRQQ
jgi:BolA protein